MPHAPLSVARGSQKAFEGFFKHTLLLFCFPEEKHRVFCARTPQFQVFAAPGSCRSLFGEKGHQEEHLILEGASILSQTFSLPDVWEVKSRNVCVSVCFSLVEGTPVLGCMNQLETKRNTEPFGGPPIFDTHPHALFACGLPLRYRFGTLEN